MTDESSRRAVASYVATIATTFGPGSAHTHRLNAGVAGLIVVTPDEAQVLAVSGADLYVMFAEGTQNATIIGPLRRDTAMYQMLVEGRFGGTIYRRADP